MFTVCSPYVWSSRWYPILFCFFTRNNENQSLIVSHESGAGKLLVQKFTNIGGATQETAVEKSTGIEPHFGGKEFLSWYEAYIYYMVTTWSLHCHYIVTTCFLKEVLALKLQHSVLAPNPIMEVKYSFFVVFFLNSFASLGHKKPNLTITFLYENYMFITCLFYNHYIFTTGSQHLA